MKTLDLSIAAVINITGLSSREREEIYFEETVPFEGDYVLTVSTMENKRGKVINDCLTALENRLTWDLNPNDQGISEGLHYWEIFDTDIERVVYKGTINISK